MAKPFFEYWLDVNKSDLVLDVGCGEGSKVDYLNKNKLCSAFGVDINKKALLSYGFKNMICANALNLPFRKNTFDKVICTEVLEHIEDDDTVLENIKCVLKQNGLLFLSTPRHIQLFDYWDPAWLKWKLIKSSYIHKHYSVKNLIKKLESHSFRIKKCRVLFSYAWLIVRWINVFLKYVLKSKYQIQYTRMPNGKFDIFILAQVKK
jgi:2-polyprenyl-3-methyl-5-hydroxy-6-metoxy-1,4-benzoquinol methylase